MVQCVMPAIFLLWFRGMRNTEQSDADPAVWRISSTQSIGAWSRKTTTTRSNRLNEKERYAVGPTCIRPVSILES